MIFKVGCYILMGTLALMYWVVTAYLATASLWSLLVTFPLGLGLTFMSIGVLKDMDE